MNFEIIDPVEYPDWDSLLLANNDHSFFHSSAWAKVLKISYGYRPVYLVSLTSGQLDLMMPLMEVTSSLTGKRGVSLPFTDQCAPHAPKREFLPEAVQGALDYGRKAGWRYIEWRDACCFPGDTLRSEVYFIHEIDLKKTDQELFSSLGESNRRCIRKATKEGVSVDIGQSLDLLRSFFRLNCLTRKRHGLPPQPFVFFRNVFDHIISKSSGIIVSAFHFDKLVAAAVFFHFGDKAIYKYGASDLAHQRFRPNNLLMWEAMKWYKSHGLKSLNLGKTEEDNQGLLRFKRLWGGQEKMIEYHRYDLINSAFVQRALKMHPFLKNIFTHMPVPALRLAGRWLYKHAG